MSANFRLEKNNYLYMYHWINSDTPFKVSTKVKLTPAQWDKTKQMPKDISLKDSEGVKVIDTIAKYRSSLTDALAECKVTHKDLKTVFYTKLSGQIIRGGASASISIRFLEFFENMVLQFEQVPLKSDRRSYRDTFGKLDKYFGRTRPTFNALDVQFFADFQRHLIKLDLKPATIIRHLKNINIILNLARKKGLHTNLAYKDFDERIELEKPVNVALTMPEITAINNLDLSKLPKLEDTRNYFVIGCLTALRFADWSRVSTDLIRDGVLTMRSLKTDETQIILVHKYVQAILDKYKGTLPEPLDNQKTNRYIRLICKEAKINTVYEKKYTKGGIKHIDKLEKWQMCSTHTARRSACSILVDQGINPYDVKKVSGHRNVKSLEDYIKRDESQLIEALKKIDLFN